MTRQEPCTTVMKGIRGRLDESVRDAVRFRVRSSQSGMTVIIPQHRANKALVAKGRVSHHDPERLIALAVDHFTQFVPVLAA